MACVGELGCVRNVYDGLPQCMTSICIAAVSHVEAHEDQLKFYGGVEAGPTPTRTRNMYISSFRHPTMMNLEAVPGGHSVAVLIFLDLPFESNSFRLHENHSVELPLP